MDFMLLKTYDFVFIIFFWYDIEFEMLSDQCCAFSHCWNFHELCYIKLKILKSFAAFFLSL